MTQQLYSIRAYNYESEDFNYILPFYNSAVKLTLKRKNNGSIELETRICEFLLYNLGCQFWF